MLTQSDTATAVDRYLQECKDVGFDIVEISTGFLSLPPDDWLRLVDKVRSYGIKAKPEVGIQFGAGGDTEASDLESMGTSDPSKVIILRGGLSMMIESEGITENVKSRRTDAIQAMLRNPPVESVMFEAAEPKVLIDELYPDSFRTAVIRSWKRNPRAPLPHQFRSERTGTASVARAIACAPASYSSRMTPVVSSAYCISRGFVSTLPNISQYGADSMLQVRP